MDKPFPAYRGESAFIFVCYAHEDAEVVYPELDWLHGEGVQIWYDEGISVGRNWRAEIGTALDRAAKVLFYISPHSLASDHCNREINYALDEGKEIVPVYLEPVELTPDLKIGLNRVQATHRSDADYRDRLLGALAVDGDRESAPATNPAPETPRSGSRARNRLVAVLVLAALAALTWRMSSPGDDAAPVAPAAAEAPGVAVLPFENLSEDAEAGYIGDGIAEDVLNRLTRVQGIKVIARTSTFQLRDEGRTLAEIGATLGVSHVLEGSVRRAGDRLRVTAKLVDAASGTPVWSEQFDREVDDVFAIQDDISLALADRLKVDLGGEAPARDAVPIAAYALVQQARRSRAPMSRDGLEHAIAMTREALEIAPEYVDAWTELAFANWLMWDIRYDPAPARREAAEAASARAVELDPEHPASLVVLALLEARFRGNWARGFELVRAAIDVAPGDSSAIFAHGTMLAMAGRVDEAIAESERALELDPLNANFVYIYGIYLHFAGDLDGALTYLLRARDMGSASPWFFSDLALLYHRLGDDARAFELYRDHVVPAELRDVAIEGYRAGGYLGSLARLRERVTALSGDPCQPMSFGSAFSYALLQQPDPMFECLRVAAGENRILHLMGHLQFHRYRSDPRFREILELAGLDAVVDPALLAANAADAPGSGR